MIAVSVLFWLMVLGLKYNAFKSWFVDLTALTDKKRSIPKTEEALFMNSCTVAYAFYETDFRIRRFAEALSGPGARTDAIALQTETTKKFEIIEGVSVYRIQKKGFRQTGRSI